ncbi:hypothetical protein ES703_36735 [subsurface metagenome]
MEEILIKNILKLSMETIEYKNKTQLFTLLFTLFSVIFNNLL